LNQIPSDKANKKGQVELAKKADITRYNCKGKTIEAKGEITGEITRVDMPGSIFSTYCNQY